MERIAYEDVFELVSRDMEGMSDYAVARWIADLVIQLTRKDEFLRKDVIKDIAEMREQEND